MTALIAININVHLETNRNFIEMICTMQINSKCFDGRPGNVL